VSVLGVVLLLQVTASMARHIVFPYEMWEWAEGHFIYNAMQLSKGQNIYTDPSKLPVTAWPYGPLYPLILAPLVRLFGPQLWVGRAVSAMAGSLCLAMVVSLCVRRSGSVAAGLCGGVLACGSYFLAWQCWDWGHSDSLFVAFGLGSLTCVERLGRPGDTRRVALAAVLSCASCCAKQTGAGFILAVGGVLFVRWWRLGILYTMGCVLLMGSVWMVGHFLTDGQFERYMLMFLGDPYLPSKIPSLLKVLLLGAPLYVVAAGLQTARDLPRSGWADPIAWAIVCVGLPSIAAYLKFGGWLNNVMPLFILLAVPAGVWLSRMIFREGPVTGHGLAAIAGLLLQFLLIERPVVAEIGGFSLIRKSAIHYRQAGRLIERELQDPNERVWMADRISFAIRAGKPVYDTLQIAGFGRGYRGPGAEVREHIHNRLLTQLAQRSFDKILIPRDELDILRSDVRQTLLDNYTLDHVILPRDYLAYLVPMLVFRAVRGQAH